MAFLGGIVDKWLDGLNPEQKIAASHSKGPLLILAGAGSGKTTVLVSRTGRIVAEGEARPDQVRVMTFTNKSARELKERVALKLGGLAKGLWAGTFHSFGLDFLKQNHKEVELPKRFAILDQTDSAGIVKELLSNLTHSGKSDFDIDTILKNISDWRELGKNRSLQDDPYHDVTEWLLPKYRLRKLEMGAVDFDDLILLPAQVIKSNPRIKEQIHQDIRYLMVDEFQDTNHGQMQLISQILNADKNIGVVGDDDQSIYGWRGAQIKNILDFPKRNKGCKVVRLEKNYRSTPAILNLANTVIAKNEDRHAKVLQPRAGIEGKPPELFIYDNEEKEADGVVDQIQHFRSEGHNLKDLAILYRSNTQGGVIEGALKRAMIDYQITGGMQIMDRKEARDSLAYLKAALFRDELSIRRTLNLPSRGIGPKFLAKVDQLNAAEKSSYVHCVKRVSREENHANALNYFEKLDVFASQLISAEDPHRAWMVFFRDLGYRDHLMKIYKKPESVAKRWEVIDIVGRILMGFFERGGRTEETLRDFVEKLSLRDTMDDKKKDEDVVQLMTLHASKGLEFPIVILAGIDEDILPHYRLGSDISEERRLFYVGLTRAKSFLILTRSRMRRRHGRLQECAPSRFLNSISGDLLTRYEDGFRPVTAIRREQMVGDLLKKLKNKSIENSGSI